MLTKSLSLVGVGMYKSDVLLFQGIVKKFVLAINRSEVIV
jgi:hypothetical protein